MGRFLFPLVIHHLLPVFRNRRRLYVAIITFVLLITSTKLLLQVTVACLNKLFGNLVLRLLSITSVLVFRNCYTFLSRLLSVLTEYLNGIGILLLRYLTGIETKVQLQIIFFF